MKGAANKTHKKGRVGRFAFFLCVKTTAKANKTETSGRKVVFFGGYTNGKDSVSRMQSGPAIKVSKVEG